MAWRKVTDIEAWNLSMKLAKEFDAILDRPPACNDRKFCEEAREAADSVPRNIAEGFGRYGDREFARFVEIGYGSLLETYTNLVRAGNRRFMSGPETERLMPLYEETKATTLGLLKSLKRRIAEEERERPRRKNSRT